MSPWLHLEAYDSDGFEGFGVGPGGRSEQEGWSYEAPRSPNAVLVAPDLSTGACCVLGKQQSSRSGRRGSGPLSAVICGEGCIAVPLASGVSKVAGIGTGDGGPVATNRAGVCSCDVPGPWPGVRVASSPCHLHAGQTHVTHRCPWQPAAVCEACESLSGACVPHPAAAGLLRAVSGHVISGHVWEGLQERPRCQSWQGEEVLDMHPGKLAVLGSLAVAPRRWSLADSSVLSHPCL
jgi:hypothetical protein